MHVDSARVEILKRWVAQEVGRDSTRGTGACAKSFVKGRSAMPMDTVNNAYRRQCITNTAR
jgi:hypothetical protein